MVFNWSGKTAAQRAEKLTRDGKEHKATKDLNQGCCLAECFNTRHKVFKGEYYTSIGIWLAHNDCISKTLEPFHPKVQVVTDKPNVGFSISMEDLMEDFEVPKYSSDSWEPVIDEATANLMTVNEAAKHLGMATRTVYNYIKKGKLTKVGNLIDVGEFKEEPFKATKDTPRKDMKIEINEDITWSPSTMDDVKDFLIGSCQPNNLKPGTPLNIAKTNKNMEDLISEVAYLRGKMETMDNMIETLFKPLIMKLANK